MERQKKVLTAESNTLEQMQSKHAHTHLAQNFLNVNADGI